LGKKGHEQREKGGSINEFVQDDTYFARQWKGKGNTGEEIGWYFARAREKAPSYTQA